MTWQRRQRKTNSNREKTSKLINNGQVQVSGQVAVMEINGLLVKDHF